MAIAAVHRPRIISTAAALLAVVAVAGAVAGEARGAEGVAAAPAAAMVARHERWMARFGRAYADAGEKARRLGVFRANAEHVDAVNRAGNRTYTLGLNQFSDLTDAEFAAAHLGYHRHEHEHGLDHELGMGMGMAAMSSKTTGTAVLQDYVPDSVDWRSQGAVTGVKNQRYCGSCWAFAAVAATEGLVQIATGALASLSEQQVLDCTGSADTCDGGDVFAALRYIAATGGLQQEDAYPYTAQQGACRGATMAPNSAASIAGFRWARLDGDEGTLQALAANQPVAVVVEASDPDFRHYRGGVYTGSATCGQRLNHAVTVVGYGTAEGGEGYWVVKNQWGTWWGERGYIRIARGSGANCGIATYAYYPTINN